MQPDRRANTHLTGWCNDPYGRHEHRWLTAGEPSALVGDGGVESHDPPPDGSFVVEPVLVKDKSVDVDDLRRADGPMPRDAGQAVWDETIGRLPYP
jgi:hypothetical protein